MDEKLLKECEPLIKNIAKKFYNVEYDDLIQAGKLGLINAYKHYKMDSNTKFSTFAYSYIFGEMYNLSISSKLSKSRELLRVSKLVEKAKNYLTQTLCKEPTVDDISTYLNIDKNIILDTLNNNDMLSLDNNDYLYNNMKYNLDNDLKIDLFNYINELDYPEKDIIMYRYFTGLTQNEIANILNISQVNVSRYEKKTLKRIKNEMICE